MPASKHHPNGGATLHCDSSRIERAIAQYQATHDVESLSQVIELAQPRAQTLIKFRKTYRYRPEDELLSDINFKLLRAVDKFDPLKGSAFTFVSQVISNVLYTSVANARRDSARYRELTNPFLDRLVTNGETESQHRLDDLAHHVRSDVRTTLSDETEILVTRWYVESFLDDRFEARRHECVNAAMALYPLNRGRLCEIYDLCMLETRRILYDDLKEHQSIAPGRLLGSRFAWMARYQPLLTQKEFEKFFRLVKGLSPFVVLIINPESTSRRRDRNPTISRQNLLWILSGHPNSVRLFK